MLSVKDLQIFKAGSYNYICKVLDLKILHAWTLYFASNIQTIKEGWPTENLASFTTVFYKLK